MSRDYYGSLAGQKHWFIGVVKDTNDPNNRVRVQIKGLHPENASSTTTVGGSSSGSGDGGSTGASSSGGNQTPGGSQAGGGSSGAAQAPVTPSRDDLPTSTQFSAQLSPHFTLGSLVAGKYRGLANKLTPTIIYNLKNLAVNCLEPLKAQFPGMIITCGWRPPGAVNGNQNHPNGYACDFQVPGQSPAAVCNWIKQNLRGRYNFLEQGTRHIHIQLGGTSRQGSLSNPLFRTGTSV